MLDPTRQAHGSTCIKLYRFMHDLLSRKPPVPTPPQPHSGNGAGAFAGGHADKPIAEFHFAANYGGIVSPHQLKHRRPQGVIQHFIAIEMEHPRLGARIQRHLFLLTVAQKLVVDDAGGAEEFADVLGKDDALASWAEDVKAYALARALQGTRYPGFKLVEGRSNRRYTDETKVAEAVASAGYEPYEKRLLGITAMQRSLGKKKFEELLGGLVIKPEGKPVLVSASDKRPEYHTAADDFKEENLS